MGLATAGILRRWAMQGYSAVSNCKDTLRLDIGGILCGWARHGYSAQAVCGGQGNIGFLRSHKPTVKVGNEHNSSGDGKYDDQSFGLRIKVWGLGFTGPACVYHKKELKVV